MFGGIERAENGHKHFFVELVDDRTESTLLEIIQRRIRPHIMIISDGWKAYTSLEEYGYIHEVVIHDDNFVDPVVPYIHTQNTENTRLVLKRFLRKHGIHKAPHDYEYIAEFFFRWQNNDVFQSFIDLIQTKYQFN
ncbi:hypothetical protein RF11_03990 [Thelohanellus kitauei]|uniref:ISXO2-like transposase domain-containing protein n=1 Tax=Thelohanellus kitauei TaxID=669202 RepID=A0A0C2M8W5_THEKT|nr:hypothetical protein RF11_03990 [Thelohanellus kitauei]